MADTTVLKVELHQPLNDRLELISRDMRRSKSDLAAEAIEAYVDLNEWQVAGIKQAMASLDRGEAIAHESVRAWVESWGTETELPKPKK
jgi:RHH-type rel operon transcriptional repressor/antitoxin RelB